VAEQGGERARIPVYAVVRYDPSRRGIAHQVMVWEVLPTIDEAETEADHLNSQVPAGRETVYFIAATCYYPEGRRVAIGPWGPREGEKRPPVSGRADEEWGFLVEGFRPPGG
jgi:hypothetical protein